MIIILKSKITSREVEALEEEIQREGLECISSKGEGRDVLVVLGDAPLRKALARRLRERPAVERIVPLLPERLESQVARRTLLDRLLIGTGVVLTLLLGSTLAAFLLKGGRKLRQVGILPVGSEQDFEKRPYRLVSFQEAPVIVFRTAESRFHALSATCTHSEICRVQWNVGRQQLGCPCHRAAFDVHGNVLHGPPPRPLRSYGVKVIQGQVYVRTIS